ncbi:SPOR domain-containing protein [Sphingomonas azotifigens]|uniref:SPOR domain-containing protein n=1 Tax=Sphingomonas azotifigens TaxID=330920 RepID=UPI0009FE222C|nr:SPOR domain-containing protein [Sphingomonas azotifigens]
MRMTALFLLASIAAPASALAQTAAVKAGVEAYERGDYAGAMRHWRPAAEKGDADAQYNLGQVYKLGRGVPVDLAEAEKWYRLAALQGHDLAEANYGMVLFENGKREAAVPWLERAVTRGEPRAQYLLGVMLFNGDGVAKNWVRAYALMLRAAGGGLEPATRTLAQMDQYIPLADRQAGELLARTDDHQAQVTTLPTRKSSPPRGSPAISADTSVATAPAAPPPKPARAATTTPATAPVRAAGTWRVQLGAFATPGNAERLWAQLHSRFPGRQPYYLKSGQLTRLLVGPFPSQAEATKACGAIKPCMAMQH